MEIVVQNDSLVVVAKEDSLRPDVNSADSGERDTGEIPTELLELYAKVAEAQSMVESEVFVASDSNELRNQRRK